MVEDVPTESGGHTNAPQCEAGWSARSVTMWWATLLAGVIVALAVADVLPKIPW